MSSPTVEIPADEMPTETAIANNAAPVAVPPASVPTVETYQETLLGAAIKAATLLDELMELSIIPDPRVKDAADVALQLVALMNAQGNRPTTPPAATKKTTKSKTKAS